MQLISSALEEQLRAYPARAPVVQRMLAVLGMPEGSPFSRLQFDPGHFTASAFVLCPEGTKVLLVHHAKLGRWLQPGGHVESGDVSLFAAAQREAVEETGVRGLTPLAPGIFDVDIHAIPPSAREESHAHFDVRYAFQARTLELTVSSEVQAARWVELGAVLELNPDESVIRCVERLRSRVK
jgi:8-oxo-dGTP pyrophosphatase MutT (NUDIX family)